MAKSSRTQIILSEQDRSTSGPQVCPESDHHPSLGNELTLLQTMRTTGMTKAIVCRCWDRFLEEGVDGLLYDIRRGGGRKPIPEEKVREMIDLAISTPSEHASQALMMPVHSAVARSPRSRKDMEKRALEAVGIGIVKESQTTRESA